MEESQATTKATRRNRASGRAPAFRVCTADDFGSAARQPQDNRRAAQTTTACQMCRVRKVKCILVADGETPREDHQRQSWTETARPPCRPCRQSGLGCVWDVVDGRKRKRTRESASSLKGQQQPRIDHIQSRIVGANDDPGTSQPRAGNISAPHAELPSISERSSARFEASEIPLSSVNAQTDGAGRATAELWPISQSQFLPGDFQGSSQLFAELCRDGEQDLAGEWPDLSNYVLGFDFMDEMEAVADEPCDGPGIPSPSQPTQPQIPERRAGRARVIRLRYYRRFGPTAVIPGLRKLSVVVDPDHDQDDDGGSGPIDQQEMEYHTSPGTVSSSSSGSSAAYRSKIFDKTGRQPHPDMIPVILDTFFDRFGGHFPFLNADILSGHVRSGEASSFLLNAIAALTIRFCPLEGALAAMQEKHDIEWRRGAPFLAKAKEQLVPLLSIPAPEVVAGLLVLAWAEFGDKNEAGLWMFAGMAIRMAQDLGFHRSPERNINADTAFYDQARPSPDGNYVLTDEQSIVHQQKARLVMFWSVFIIDVCVSLVTGRPPTIRRSEIEVPLPTPQDMKLTQLDFEETITMGNMIFPETVAFMLHFADAVEALNEKTSLSFFDKNQDPQKHHSDCLSQIKDAMSRRYASLPAQLKFDADNFRLSSCSNQAGLFLVTHLFFHMFLILLSPPNTKRQTTENFVDTRIINRQTCPGRVMQSIGQQQQEKLGCALDAYPWMSIMAGQKVVQIMTVADLVNEMSYLATPFTSHCLFVAASADLQITRREEYQSDAESASMPQSSELLSSLAGNDYDFLLKRLHHQARYFGAVGLLAALLEHRKEALAEGLNDDFEASSDGSDGESNYAERVVGLGDQGILNRYKIPQQRGTRRGPG